ncbi:hypothetical protein NPX13_g2082 [Xylaria arbuscula]|uniref:Uncharacterized protein n=1 Tax=Xylaria arbuscula TaxID=114810 RepID=A0A9W8NKP7_9PEZI|nr:hypothetical protein NPX13_g2082 [Xylaria arbuscula]
MFASAVLGSGLALLASTQLVAAQASLNLTLTFYPDEDNTCSNDASKAVSFSTASYPIAQSCFNLDEIFANNSIGGFRNMSTTSLSDEGIRWAITNSRAWDPMGNYSHVRYEQLDPTGEDDDGDDELTWSSRRVNLYNGDDCLQASDHGEDLDLYPWISWTCHSTEDDHCRTAPYSIKSFFILPIDSDDMDGKCLDFAVYGAGARSLPHAFGALVSAIVVGFFLM